jgi:hypothetical protein
MGELLSEVFLVPLREDKEFSEPARPLHERRKEVLLGRMTSGATSTEGASTATSVAGPGSADGGSINTASSPNKNPEAKTGAGGDQSGKDLPPISSLVKDPEAISFLAMEFEKVKNGEASSIQVGSRSKSFSSKTILTVSPLITCLQSDAPLFVRAYGQLVPGKQRRGRLTHRESSASCLRHPTSLHFCTRSMKKDRSPSFEEHLFLVF